MFGSGVAKKIGGRVVKECWGGKIFLHIFLAENCTKMKEFGPPGRRAFLAFPLRSATDFRISSCILRYGLLNIVLLK